jgi:hypothetical protein
VTASISVSFSSQLTGQGGNNQNTRSGSANYTWTHSDNYSNQDTYSYSEGPTDSFTNYQAGCYANGSYAYTSVVFRGTGTVPWTFHHYSNDTETSSGTLTSNLNENFSSTATIGANFIQGSGTHTDSSSDASSFTAHDSNTLDSTGSSSYTGYAAGCFTNGSYSFSSYTYAAAGLGTFNLNVNHTQSTGETFSDTNSDSSIYTFTGANYNGNDSIGYGSSENANFNSTETYTENLNGGTTYSVYEAGTYGQHSFNLSSVLFQETGSWTAHSTYNFGQSQSGTANSSWSDSGASTLSSGGTHPSNFTGSYSGSGSMSQNFNATLTVNYYQFAFNTFTSYQAGSWSNGSYGYSSATYDGSGSISWNMNSSETWNANGSGNVNNSSSGAGTSGVQGNYSYTFSSNYNMNGSASGGGSYTLHEEGTNSNGSYSLSNMAYSVQGSGTNSETYSGADTQTSSSSATNYNYNDSYNGSATGNTTFSLSEAGNYSNHSWAVTSFTESEQTTTSANYTDAGAFSGNGNSGNFTFTSSSSSNFNLAANGSYANGSFSFVTFSASLVAQASTTHTETGTSPGCGNYSRTDTTSHSVNLTELEKKRLSNTANYTLTLSDSASHTFTCGTFTYTGSSSVTTTATGSFSLAGGNPYIPNAGGIAQAAGAQVGVQIPWYSSGGQGGGGSGSGRGGQGAGPNRVTVSVQRITAERLEPQWMNIAPDVANVNSSGVATSDTGNQNFFNAVPGPDVGLPSAGGDEPNLGLPAGPNGPAALSNSANGTAFAFGSAYSGAGGLLLPPLTSPQQSPNNKPYQYSFQTSGGNCYCPTPPDYPIPPTHMGEGVPLSEIREQEGESKGIGQPGFGESLIPVWGSGRAAIDDFQNGRWGWGLFNTAMAVSDIFLVKSIVTAGGKLVVKGGAKLLARKAGSDGLALAGRTSGRVLEVAAEKGVVSASKGVLAPDLAKYARNILPKPGFTDVIIHGTEQAFEVLHKGKWVKLTHRDLANFLKSEGITGNIRLISCDAGKGRLAQDLANKLGVTVEAANRKVFIRIDAVSPPLLPVGGQWIPFVPGG